MLTLAFLFNKYQTTAFLPFSAATIRGVHPCCTSTTMVIWFLKSWKHGTQENMARICNRRSIQEDTDTIKLMPFQSILFSNTYPQFHGHCCPSFQQILHHLQMPILWSMPQWCAHALHNFNKSCQLSEALLKSTMEQDSTVWCAKLHLQFSLIRFHVNQFHAPLTSLLETEQWYSAQEYTALQCAGRCCATILWFPSLKLPNIIGSYNRGKCSIDTNTVGPDNFWKWLQTCTSFAASAPKGYHKGHTLGWNNT